MSDTVTVPFRIENNAMLGRGVLVAFFALLCACAGIRSEIPVRAEWAGQPIHTTVDSALAQYYLEHYPSGGKIRPELDSLIENIEAGMAGGLPSREYFQSLAQRHSVDFAALILWQRLRRDPASRPAQEVFAREVSKLKHFSVPNGDPVSAKSDYLIVFAPGWFYRSQPENGADFAKPRAALAQAGADTTLLGIDENGAVEHNAGLIAEQLRRLGHHGRKIILVSASKAGPEVALALTEMQQTDEAHPIKAWVNIGGLLHGSALADRALTWPTRWYVKLFVIAGRSFDGIESLVTSTSIERARRTRLPPPLLIVNYVGIPLSGQVSERARTGYALLRAEGPNDGLTPILDEIMPGGIIIPELGLDHFYNDPDMPIKTVALARTVIRLIEAGTKSPPKPALNL